jgi:hypothetical protein
MSVGTGRGEPQRSAGPIYGKVSELLRRAEQRSPSVLALRSHWLTMAPGELVENALVIGRSLVGNFDKGAELLDCAEEQTGASLSPRAYGALARLGEDEQRHAEVLALLGRMRAAGVEPGPSMLLTAMRAAAQLGDWGGVSRLFAEYAGTDDAVEALELIGDISVVQELKTELRGGAPSNRVPKLTAADTEALRLALQAHCARGDVQMVGAVIRSARELDSALDLNSYKRVLGLALSQKSAAALTALRLSDAGRSLREATAPIFIAMQARASRMSRSEKELFTVTASAAVGVILLAWLASSGETGQAGFSSDGLSGFEHIDAL